MGSKQSTSISSVPENTEGNLAKSEKVPEMQPDKTSADGRGAAMNPVDSHDPNQLPPRSWYINTGREVKGDDEHIHKNPVQEKTEAETGLPEEPGSEEALGEAEHAQGWPDALDLPESAENETVLPHKEAKPPHKEIKDVLKGVAASQKE